MKSPGTALAIVVAVSASLALSEDFKTVSGKEYKNATVSRVEADGIMLRTKSGITKVYFVELPKEIQQRFGYDVEAIKAAEEKRFAEQNAADRERAERAKNADADLKRSVEEFQAAEQRASKAYESASKGTLSGQVFVFSAGRENFKLGAVQVGLFDRDAIERLLAELKKYADYNIQQLNALLPEAKAALEQANANYGTAVEAAGLKHGGDYNAAFAAENAARKVSEAAYKRLSEVRAKLDYYYSGAFYFAFLLSPTTTAETDAEGKFIFEVPRTGKFVIAAQAARNVIRNTEQYYWLQPVALNGQQQLTQNLSNNNLTSATGTSALIKTQD